MDNLWKEFSLFDGSDSSITIGNLEVRIVGKSGGARIHLDGRALESTELKEGWRDISLPEDYQIRIVPRTPDLPVVLRPDEPIELAVDARFDFEVLLPVWAEIRHTYGKYRKRDDGLLFDLPTRSLKRSWFGTPESGEVAYTWSFSPNVRRTYQRFLMTVPVTIENRSNATLHFERFLLRVIHLGVYRINNQLSTNHVTVVFKGSEQMSQITFEPNDSVARRGGILLSSPRMNSSNDMIRKSFGWLKELAI